MELTPTIPSLYAQIPGDVYVPPDNTALAHLWLYAANEKGRDEAAKPKTIANIVVYGALTFSHLVTTTSDGSRALS